jgi:deoxyribonuclease I
MDWAYPGHGVVSKKNRKLFQAWAKGDPVDAWDVREAGGLKGFKEMRTHL